jgi:hypothetical protein
MEADRRTEVDRERGTDEGGAIAEKGGMEERKSMGGGLASQEALPLDAPGDGPQHKVSSKIVYLRLPNENKGIWVSGDDGQKLRNTALL